MKKYVIAGIVLVILLSLIGGLLKTNTRLKEQVSIEANNYKAELLAKEGINRVLQLTKDQFKNEQDSIMKKMDSIIRENKIKDKTIRQLEYSKQSIIIKDSIITKDSIIKEGVNLDTTLLRSYYKLQIGVKSPNIIRIDSLVLENEHYVIFNSKKETIRPKKCWPLRWFQRKHTVIEVTIDDSNPYVKSSNNKFIEIIK